MIGELRARASASLASIHRLKVSSILPNPARLYAEYVSPITGRTAVLRTEAHMHSAIASDIQDGHNQRNFLLELSGIPRF